MPAQDAVAPPPAASDHSRILQSQSVEPRCSDAAYGALVQRLHEAESRLALNEKLASVGRLSAGVIHEINNPLNFVKSALFVLRKKVHDMPPETVPDVVQILTDIDEGVDRAASIVSDLRTFFHPGNRPAVLVNLHHVLRKALRLLALQIDDSGTVVRSQVPEDVTVLGDENHVLQILINLLLNGVEATTGRPAPEITIQAGADDDHTVLRVRDNGPGIPVEHMARIFEPFFTTKDAGQGMGLGLSLCRRMMQDMGGAITATSRAGSQTEFALRFQPAAAFSPAAAA